MGGSNSHFDCRIKNEMITVAPIPLDETRPWILVRHYAHRMPCVTDAFGLYVDAVLRGIVTFGPTPTPAVQQHICGAKWSFYVCELNRLVIENVPNGASMLVRRAMSLLSTPRIIVSYADGGVGHKGYVYQAAGFLYTGAVTAHDAEYLVNGVKTHARSITARGISNPTQWAREQQIERIDPQPKHRYVAFCGSRTEIRQMRQALTYKIYEKYPKGTSARYDADTPIEKQSVLF